MRIRTATQSEFTTAIQWAETEGWNPGVDDLPSFFATDPNGFLLGFVNDEPVAAISVVKYADNFGFLGFYIVREDQRGKNYGMAIWNAGMDYLQGCNIGLDGVVAQQDNYRKSGFTFAHNNIRFAGTIAKPSKINLNVQLIDDTLFDKVKAYDRSVFPSSRADFLSSWLSNKSENRVSLSYIQNKQLLGFGTIRTCIEGHKIGPLFADSETIARELIMALCNKVSGDLIYLDVPEPNQKAVQLAQSLGMKPVFETARMYTGLEPDIDMNRIFGITTFELG